MIGDYLGRLNRNLYLLLLCQLVSVSGSVLLVTLGGIVGESLAGDPRLATLPMSLMVVGTALGTVPASLMMRRIGRRWGFCAALLAAAGGMGIAVTALRAESFVLFCLATSVVGFSLAASQQYRFAAAESVDADWVSQAVSLVLIGSIGGALLAPELVKLSGGSLEGFETPVMTLLALYLVAALAVTGYAERTPLELDQAVKERGHLRSLLRSRFLITAVCGGVVGQGVMTLIMTATPISMHVLDGFTLVDTANVIRNHVLAMYIPSLFSGWLIARFGVGRVTTLGAVVTLLTVVVGLMGHAYMHYSLSMIALGVGWNFLFVGGTTMLVRAQDGRADYSAQAFNDFCVFGGSAAASLGAGVLLHSIGWDALLLCAVPVVGLYFLLLASVRRDPRFG